MTRLWLFALVCCNELDVCSSLSPSRGIAFTSHTQPKQSCSSCFYRSLSLSIHPLRLFDSHLLKSDLGSRKKKTSVACWKQLFLHSAVHRASNCTPKGTGECSSTKFCHHPVRQTVWWCAALVCKRAAGRPSGVLLKNPRKWARKTVVQRAHAEFGAKRCSTYPAETYSVSYNATNYSYITFVDFFSLLFHWFLFFCSVFVCFHIFMIELVQNSLCNRTRYAS